MSEHGDSETESFRYEVLDNEHLFYCDGPWEGFARSHDGELYAFRVRAIIPHVLFHWTLIPAASSVASVDQASKDYLGTNDSWISIVEDLRTPRPIYREVRLDPRKLEPRDFSPWPGDSRSREVGDEAE